MSDCVRNRIVTSLVWASCFVLSCHTAAYAQAVDANGQIVETNSVDSESFDRGRNVSVRQRPRPEYDAIGLQVGGFMVYPKTVVGLAYDDNIFAVQKGALGDEIFTVAPEVDFQSTWSRNALSGYARISRDQNFRFATESATQYGAGINGKYEFGQSYLTGGIDYGHYVLPRSASNNVGFSKDRIPFDYEDLNAQLVHEFTRLRISARVDDQLYDYQNGKTNAGAIVFEQDENRSVTTVAAKAEYAISPDAAVLIVASGNQRSYELNPPRVPFTRDSSGYEVDVGANFDISHLMRGELQIGYLDQHYESILFKDIEGLSAKAQLEWFPTQLTTVTLAGSRAVGDAGIVNSAGFLSSNASAQIDHELLRNLILSGNLSYGDDQYNGIDRTDIRGGAGVSAHWLLNRNLGLTFAYNYSNQQSSGVNRGISFIDNRLSISSVVQF
jgi:hypothetical protein